MKKTLKDLLMISIYFLIGAAFGVVIGYKRGQNFNQLLVPAAPSKPLWGTVAVRTLLNEGSYKQLEMDDRISLSQQIALDVITSRQTPVEAQRARDLLLGSLIGIEVAYAEKNGAIDERANSTSQEKKS